MHTKDYSKQETWREITKRMSPQLHCEVSREVNKPWVLRVSYLRKCSWPMIASVSGAMEVERYAHMETFGSPLHLYILNRGLATRCRSYLQLLSPGAVWGDEHLLLTNPELLDDLTAVAVSFLEVMSLQRSRFEQIVKDNPENRHRIRRYYVRYAVRCGIRHKAKLLKQTEEQAEEIIPPAEEEVTDELSRHRVHKLRSQREIRRRGSNGSIESALTDCADLTEAEEGGEPTRTMVHKSRNARAVRKFNSKGTFLHSRTMKAADALAAEAANLPEPGETDAAAVPSLADAGEAAASAMASEVKRLSNELEALSRLSETRHQDLMELAASRLDAAMGTIASLHEQLDRALALASGGPADGAPAAGGQAEAAEHAAPPPWCAPRDVAPPLAPCPAWRDSREASS